MANGSVWCLTTPKGGAGKTTLALVLAGELARLGKTVSIIDADPNAPLKVWYDKGNAPANITVIVDSDENGGTIRANILEARKTSEFVIVDTEGTNNTRSTFAIGSSDLVIIPMQSSPEDLRHAVRALEFTRQVGGMRGTTIPAILVRTRSNGAITDAIEKEIDAAMIKGQFEQCPVRLLEKAAFRAIVFYGCTLEGVAGFTKIGGVNSAAANAAALLKGIAAAYGRISARIREQAA
jgi:chromosome partitioning protein